MSRKKAIRIVAIALINSLSRFIPFFVLKNSMKGQKIILCFHSVSPPSLANSWKNRNLEISLSKLRNLLLTLKRAGFVFSSTTHVAEVMIGARNEKSPVVAFTFDDSYIGWDSELLALFEEFNAPLTFFVSTGFLQGENGFWWMESQTWISKVSKSRAISDVDSRLELGRSQIKFRNNASDYSCSWSNIVRLSKSPLVSIGTHTHSHLPLASIDDDEIVTEFKTNLNYLEAHLNEVAPLFAFPYGDAAAVDSRTVEVISTLPLDFAFTTADIPITNEMKRFALPRQVVSGYLTCKKDLLSIFLLQRLKRRFKKS